MSARTCTLVKVVEFDCNARSQKVDCAVQPEPICGAAPRTGVIDHSTWYDGGMAALRTNIASKLNAGVFVTQLPFDCVVPPGEIEQLSVFMMRTGGWLTARVGRLNNEPAAATDSMAMASVFKVLSWWLPARAGVGNSGSAASLRRMRNAR